MSVLLKDAVQWSEAERIKALKRIVPARAIRSVLQRTGRGLRPCRRLPRWQRRNQKKAPGRSTLCEARHSIGAAPLKLLAEEVIQLQAQPETPQCFYGGMRLMALDSFVLDVADTPANERAFGRPGSGRAPGAFPQARVLSLCEVGTHILWRSLIKPCARAEVPMAAYLLRFLAANMLLLWDRGFLSYARVRQVIDSKAQLLARVKSHMVFVPVRRLSDGSYRAHLYRKSSDRERKRNGIPVRIIEYTFNDPARPGTGEKHRLMTTLLDARQHPAKRLIVLYHERWEEELAFDELKTHLRERPVLRSGTPGGVVQEI